METFEPAFETIKQVQCPFDCLVLNFSNPTIQTVADTTPVMIPWKVYQSCFIFFQLRTYFYKKKQPSGCKRPFW